MVVNLESDNSRFPTRARMDKITRSARRDILISRSAAFRCGADTRQLLVISKGKLIVRCPGNSCEHSSKKMASRSVSQISGRSARSTVPGLAKSGSRVPSSHLLERLSLRDRIPNSWIDFPNSRRMVAVITSHRLPSSRRDLPRGQVRTRRHTWSSRRRPRSRARSGHTTSR